VAAGVAVLAGSDEPAADRQLPVPALPAPPRAAFAIGDPVPLGDGRHQSRWTPVRRPVTARARPDAAAPAVARLPTATPEGTTHVVPALARTTDADGRLWVRVRLPVLPNGRTGWVPRRALGGYGTVTTRLVVDRAHLTATLLDGGRPVFRAPVGVGAPGSPTPRGEFLVRNRLTRYRSPFYGPVAFGTSARSAVLTD
jgi:hypothetical protein